MPNKYCSLPYEIKRMVRRTTVYTTPRDRFTLKYLAAKMTASQSDVIRYLTQAQVAGDENFEAAWKAYLIENPDARKFNDSYA